MPSTPSPNPHEAVARARRRLAVLRGLRLLRATDLRHSYVSPLPQFRRCADCGAPSTILLGGRVAACDEHAEERAIARAS